MKRITVVQCLPALHSGGVERGTLETARALVERGHRSVIVSAGGRLQAQAEAEGSEHFKCDIGNKSLLILRAVYKFREFLKELQPDIVHARSRLPAWSSLLAMRHLENKPRFITSVHGLNSPGFYSGVMLRGEKIVCVSETVKKHVLDNWPNTDHNKIVVIRPGIDQIEFPPNLQISEEWRHDFLEKYPRLQGEKILLLPARATRLKGHGLGLNLLAALRKEAGDVRLCCLGVREPGREKYLEELRSQAERLGIADFVEFTPPIKAVDKAYALSDLVLQLSNKPEAFGRTVIEALSIGRPVLGWNLGGVGENLEQYFPQGLVEPFDENALMQSAKNILQDKILPVQQSLPSLAGMQSNMMELYEQLCA
jgi:glycosyltransferase involved in cell wall biosynthesis